MIVYVLIWWFYEGDSNLVNSFEGVFSNYNKAMFRKKKIDNRNRELVSTEEAEKGSMNMALMETLLILKSGSV